MAIKIVRVPSLCSSLGDDNHDSDVTSDVNNEQQSKASEPLQNTSMPVAAEPCPIEEGNTSHVTMQALTPTTRVTIAIHAPGWIVLLFVCMSRFIQLMSGTRLGVRLLQSETSSGDSSEAPPNLNHIQPSMTLEPLPNATLSEAYVVEGDGNVTCITACKLMTTARVAVGLDAPGWIALMFISLARLIQATTGIHVDIRHRSIDILGSMTSGDLIADIGSSV